MAQPYDNLNSEMVSILPPGYIENYAYKTDTKQLEYYGWAVKGSATSDAVWSIRKTTYNVNNQISTNRLIFNAVWDDRESISYE